MIIFFFLEKNDKLILNDMKTYRLPLVKYYFKTLLENILFLF